MTIRKKSVIKFIKYLKARSLRSKEKKMRNK